MPARDLSDYGPIFEASGIDTESLTLVLVSGSTRAAVLGALGVDETQVRVSGSTDEGPGAEAEGWYAIAAVPGGFVALEHTGYADPSLASLQQLSAGAGVAAVVRGNIDAHERFGYSRDGHLVFDSDEYPFVESLEEFPEEIRQLASRAWVDLDADPGDDSGDESGDDENVGWVSMGLAEAVTGLRITSDDLVRATRGGYFRAPALVYPGD